jgi:hypothetical protein
MASRGNWIAAPDLERGRRQSRPDAAALTGDNDLRANVALFTHQPMTTLLPTGCLLKPAPACVNEHWTASGDIARSGLISISKCGVFYVIRS